MTTETKPKSLLVSVLELVVFFMAMGMLFFCLCLFG